MGGDNKPQEQRTTVELGPEQRALFQMAFPKLKEYAASVPERYQGSTIAGFNPTQIAGQQQVLDASGAQQGIVNSGANASNFWTSGNVWDPANNPALQGAVDAAVRPINQAFTEQYLPSVRSEFASAGGLGGSRQGVFEAVGAGRAAQAVGDTASKVVNDNYKTNVDAQLKALGLLPQTAMAQTIPGATTSAVGDVRQAQEQALLNEQVTNFNYDQMAPYLQAKDLISLISGMPGASTVSTASNPPTNTAGQVAGGALAGAQLGNMLLPGAGAIPGAALGGVLPFLLG